MKLVKVVKKDSKSRAVDADPQRTYQSISQNWNRCLSDLKRVKNDLELDGDEIEIMGESDRAEMYASDLGKTIEEIAGYIKVMEQQISRTKAILSKMG